MKKIILLFVFVFSNVFAEQSPFKTIEAINNIHAVESFLKEKNHKVEHINFVQKSKLLAKYVSSKAVKGYIDSVILVVGDPAKKILMKEGYK